MKKAVISVLVIVVITLAYGEVLDRDASELMQMRETIRKAILYQSPEMLAGMCAEDVTYINYWGRLSTNRKNLESLLEEDFGELVIVPLVTMWHIEIISEGNAVLLWAESVLVYKDIEDARLL